MIGNNTYYIIVNTENNCFLSVAGHLCIYTDEKQAQSVIKGYQAIWNTSEHTFPYEVRKVKLLVEEPKQPKPEPKKPKLEMVRYKGWDKRYEGK